LVNENLGRAAKVANDQAEACEETRFAMKRTVRLDVMISQLSNSLFLTATDTNAGKTFVASRLVRAMRAKGIDAVGFKPLCCGGREDAESLHAANDGTLSLNEVNPVWLRPPVAPYAAAMMEGRTIDLELIRETFARLLARHQAVLVEGVGGWRVPITRDYLVSDLAADFALPVAVVVANRLGAINHALLTIEAVRARKLECAGVILNRVSPEEDAAALTNRSVLEEVAAVPVLAEVNYGQETIAI
jgi:dethiobiotin synthetase